MHARNKTVIKAVMKTVLVLICLSPVAANAAEDAVTVHPDGSVDFAESISIGQVTLDDTVGGSNLELHSNGATNYINYYESNGTRLGLFGATSVDSWSWRNGGNTVDQMTLSNSALRLGSGVDLDMGSNDILNAGAGNFSGVLRVEGAVAQFKRTGGQIDIIDTDGATDNQSWSIHADAGKLTFQTRDTAETTRTNIFSIIRSGITPTAFALGSGVNLDMGANDITNGGLATLTDLDVIKSGGGGTYDGAVYARVTNDTTAGAFAGLAITGGDTGGAFIDLGKTGDTDAGRILYRGSTGDLEFDAGGAQRLTLSSSDLTLSPGVTLRTNSGNLVVGASDVRGSFATYVNGDRRYFAPSDGTTWDYSKEIGWRANLDFYVEPRLELLSGVDILSGNLSIGNTLVIDAARSGFFNGIDSTADIGIDGGTSTDVQLKIRMGSGSGGTNKSRVSYRNSANTQIFYTEFDNADETFSIGSDIMGDLLTLNRNDGRVTIKGDLFKDGNGTPYAHPDYVFEEDYDLRELSEVATFTEQHKHLPGVPSAAEVKEQGLNMSEMMRLHLEKIEELTLYVIAAERERDEAQQRIQQLQDDRGQLEARLARLEALLLKEE